MWEQIERPNEIKNEVDRGNHLNSRQRSTVDSMGDIAASAYIWSAPDPAHSFASRESGKIC